VEIKAIAREPGSRSKVAVVATQAGIDPVGSCVGMRGVRIQNIVNELNGEKIEVVAWSPEEPRLIANALSPAKVEHVWLSAETKTATVVVPDNQLSLAIGKEGQNARLAAKLTGWRIDIKSITEAAEETALRAKQAAEAAAQRAELEAKRQAAAALLAEAEKTLREEAMATVSPGATTEPGAPQAAEPEAIAAPAEEIVAGTEPATVPEKQAPSAQEAVPEAAAVPVRPAEAGAAEAVPATTPAEAKPEAPSALEAEPATWQFEREPDEEAEDEEAKPKKGKKSKTRTQKGRAKRRMEWEDELEAW